MANITIYGAGYVGLTTAVLFANSGHKVNLIENNPKRLKILQSGKSFFYEAGVNELLLRALREDMLLITNDAKTAISSTNFIFSCVGTPDNPDGSSNLTYVFEVAESAVKLATPGTIFVQKSTVPVGTGEKIEQLFKHSRKKLSYVSNPEFLREGTAIQDSLWFDRIVVGSSDAKASQLVIDLYKDIENSRSKLARTAKITPPKSVVSQYVSTDRNSAELIKVTANAFLALKISFANSIAKLADQTGADINDVMDAVGADHRIGRAFLNAGRGYGGGCFPKDVSGLISSASDHGVDMPIMSAATDVNSSMPGYIVNNLQNALGGNLEGKRVAVLGLAFKAGTSDSRRSPGVKIANILDHSGAIVTAYDPHANGEARYELHNKISLKEATEEAIMGVEAIVIATEWPEFVNLDFSKITKGTIICDAVNSLEVSDVKRSGLQYLGVGRR